MSVAARPFSPEKFPGRRAAEASPNSGREALSFSRIHATLEVVL